MLQGSGDTNRPERRDHTEGEPRAPARSTDGHRHSDVSGVRQPPSGAGASLPSTGSPSGPSTPGDAAPRSLRRSRQRTPVIRQPLRRHDAEERQDFHEHPRHHTVPQHVHTATIVPRPKRRLRGTHSQVAHAVPHRSRSGTRSPGPVHRPWTQWPGLQFLPGRHETTIDACSMNGRALRGARSGHEDGTRRR